MVLKIYLTCLYNGHDVVRLLLNVVTLISLEC